MGEHVNSGQDQRNSRRKPSASFTMSYGQHVPDTSDAQSTKSYARITARQSSLAALKAPAGPRPLDPHIPTKYTDVEDTAREARLTWSREPSNNSLAWPFHPDHVQEARKTERPSSRGSHELRGFDFAAIDPTGTVPVESDDESKEDPHLYPQTAAFSEPTFNFDAFHDNIVTTDSPPPDHFTFNLGISSTPSMDSPLLPQHEQRKVSNQTTIPVPARKITSGISFISRKDSTASSNSRPFSSRGDPASAVTSSTSLLRSRRQSHFPPSAFQSSSTTSPAPTKSTRKSTGPSIVPISEQPDAGLVRRRPSTRGGRKSSAERGTIPKLQTSDPPDQIRDPAKVSRSIKVKSMTVTHSQSSKDLITPSRTPDPMKATSGQTTPGKLMAAAGVGVGLVPNNKRSSVMPGHATGLGARTISPTDARRMKRMSMLPSAPPVPNRRISQAPPTPQPDGGSIRPRSTAHSPSVPPMPTKSRPPSSSRTSPDPKRKSYSSGQSLSSSTSLNSARFPLPLVNLHVSTQSSSNSRLTTPKPRLDGEDTYETFGFVPPVPAIPKSYDSPASEIDQPFFSARSSGLQMLDTPTSESPGLTSFADAIMAMDLPRSPNLLHLTGPGDTPKNQDQGFTDSQTPAARKAQPNLRLPPINLPPLSTPTTAKIQSLKDVNSEPFEIPMTPPGIRGMKTPSTPMTASKAVLFARKLEDQQNAIRSSTSHHALRAAPGTIEDFGLKLPDFNFDQDDVSTRSISPFVSSSLPKEPHEFGGFMLPTLNSNIKRTSVQQKPNGPRAPSYSFAKTDTSTPVTDTSGDSTPLMTAAPTIRHVTRRSSLGRLLETTTNDVDPAKHDNMPPPKFPASAAWNSMSGKPSASPTQKSGFFKTRRKTSASSNSLLTILDSRESGAQTTSLPDAAQPSSESIQQPPVTSTDALPSSKVIIHQRHESVLDSDDVTAEEEMRKLAGKRRDLEAAARKLDLLQARAKPAKRMSNGSAIQNLSLNVFERGEIVDYPDVYFVGSKTAKKVVGDLSSTATNFGYDDDRGDYNIVEGDHLAYRYEVVDMLGKGSFGQVVRCVDHKHGRLVAIKIIRNKKRFHQQALVEVDILQKLREWDPQKKHHVVNFDQSFYFRGHLCISTDLLDMNLYEFIKIHDFRGFSLKLIRRFTKQMLSSLILLNGKKVIHCDLKPENILLAHPAHSDIKVIDFGSSCFENEKVYTYIQSRFYRSPEVILGMSYGMPIDMWSLGCILAELFTGYPIFPGENEQEQLACIMEVFGPPEKHLIEKSTRKKLFFDSMGKPRLTVSSKGKRRRPSSKDLRSVLKCDDEAFLDFITRCLRWDPNRRLTPQDALRHEFITGLRMQPPARSTRPTVSAYNSPMKRSNTMAIGSSNGIRPLPQPPAPTLKPFLMSASSTSPNKASNRRQSSAVNGTTIHQPGSKRISHAAANGAVNVTSTTRVTIHKIAPPAKPDLATAAAAVSLSK